MTSESGRDKRRALIGRIVGHVYFCDKEDLRAELEAGERDREQLADALNLLVVAKTMAEVCQRKLKAEESDSLENEYLILRKVDQLDDELRLAMHFGRELAEKDET